MNNKIEVKRLYKICEQHNFSVHVYSYNEPKFPFKWVTKIVPKNEKVN